MAWNEAINLTALRQPELIARGHVLDSLTGAVIVQMLPSRPPSPGRSMLDLGSGGGFPGLPLAFAVGAERAALVDSVNKKAAFLRAASAAASSAFTAAGESPPVFEVLAERAEDLARLPEQRAGWPVVVARAVGTVAEWLNSACRWSGAAATSLHGSARDSTRTSLERFRRATHLPAAAARPPDRASGPGGAGWPAGALPGQSSTKSATRPTAIRVRPTSDAARVERRMVKVLRALLS